MRPHDTLPLDTECAAFVDKLGQFRVALDPREQHLFDALLLAAANGPAEDVEGYGFSAASAKHLAIAAAVALGVVAGSVGPALGGTAAAAPLDQPSLNGNSGGGTRGSSGGTSGNTTSSTSNNSGGGRGSTGGTTPNTGGGRGNTGGTTVGAIVPGVGNGQVNLGGGTSSGQPQLPPRGGESHHGTGGSTSYGGGSTGTLGGPIVTGPLPQPRSQPTAADLTRQIRELQQQANLQNLPPNTRNSFTTSAPTEPTSNTPPRADNTRENLLVQPSQDPPGPDPEVQRLRDELAALLRQIRALQEQTPQPPQVEQPARPPSPAPEPPPVQQTSQPATPPSTSPFLPTRGGSDPATIRENGDTAVANAITATSLARDALNKSEDPNLSQQAREQAFAAYQAAERDRLRFEAERDRLRAQYEQLMGHQAGGNAPAPRPDPEGRIVDQTNQHHETFTRPGQVIQEGAGNAIDNAVSGSTPARAGGPTLGQSGAAANEEANRQDGPAGSPSPAPSPGRNWTQ